MDVPGQAGRKIAERYLVESLIGTGAFGHVYSAKDEMLGRTVALKVMAAERTSAAKEQLDWFLTEARTIASLDHPNIVPVYDTGVDQGVPWIAMKLIRGETFDRLLAREDKLAKERLVGLMAQAAKALDHAHRRGIVHRDIKPSNILIEKADDGSEHVWLADFGIAKILSGATATIESQIAGTPSYMSPEQITGKRIDARADIFALGCVLCEAVTGQRCFGGDTYANVVYSVVHELPAGISEVGPAAGAAIEAVVRRALAKSPEDRYQTIEEFSNALVGALEQKVEATKLGIKERLLPGFFHRSPPWNGRYALEIEELEKAYSFRKKILKGISLKVPTGSIYACLGRNGCGKSTLIRTFMGIYRRDKGSVRMLGRDPQFERGEILPRIGYVPETPAGYERMKVGEVIQFMAPFYPKSWDNAYCYDLLKRFDLPLDTRLKDLSKGSRTKVSVVTALAHRPEFLILDDPTLGLDAVVLTEVFEVLQDMSLTEGTTVFISTHNLEEVEKIATHVGFIEDGKLLLSDSVKSIKMRTRQVRLSFKDDAPKLPSIEQFRTLRASGRHVTGVVFDTSSGAIERLKALGAEEINISELDLKQIFVNLLR
jgi:ABC-type multidrug transport system ATPase subunit/predicted Ser/Thr protein kinase